MPDHHLPGRAAPAASRTLSPLRWLTRLVFDGSLHRQVELAWPASAIDIAHAGSMLLRCSIHSRAAQRPSGRPREKMTGTERQYPVAADGGTPREPEIARWCRNGTRG